MLKEEMGSVTSGDDVPCYPYSDLGTEELRIYPSCIFSQSIYCESFSRSWNVSGMVGSWCYWTDLWQLKICARTLQSEGGCRFLPSDSGSPQCLVRWSIPSNCSQNPRLRGSGVAAIGIGKNCRLLQLFYFTAEIHLTFYFFALSVKNKGKVYSDLDRNGEIGDAFIPD